MAQPTGTFATNDQVGIREDLANEIYRISPTETPFLNSVSRIQVDNVLHEWQTISLTAAADNSAIEGDDAPQDSGSATTRLNNRTQINTKDARVSGTARAVNTAGRDDELDFQVLLRGLEQRRDMETSLLTNKAKVAGDDTTARELAGLPAWLATNTDRGAGGSDPAGTGADAAGNGTQRVFTEDQLKTVLKAIFDAGGNPDILMVGAFNKQIVSSFSAGRTNMQKAEDPVLHAAFDVYESDFGQLRVVPNRFQPARDAYALQLDMFAVGFLPGREFSEWDLSKTGDSDARQILSEFTLEVRQEASSGVVADLTTS